MHLQVLTDVGDTLEQLPALSALPTRRDGGGAPRTAKEQIVLFKGPTTGTVALEVDQSQKKFVVIFHN